MRDAGIFGWATEARGTREYWFDVDAPRSANNGGRKAWSGKGPCEGTYNYNLYPYAYNSNITCKGIGWWTWFGGDPLFMHGIQWMPISPALDYLSWDHDFIAWVYDDMMSGANSDFSHAWFEDTANRADGSTIDALAKNDWGNVTLAYLQRTDAAEASRIFDRAWDEGYHITTSVSTSHISYYTIHNTLSYGLPDTRFHADCPTAIVFNRGEPVLDHIVVASSEGTVLPAGSVVALDVAAFDQYGARIDADFTLTLSEGAPASVKDSELTIWEDAASGTAFSFTVSASTLTATENFTVNPRPVPGNVRIEGAREAIEVGNVLDLTLRYTDQYGAEGTMDEARWSYVTTAGDVGETTARFTPVRPGMYTLTAVEGAAEASTAIFVMPGLPNIGRSATVVSSSEENVGTAAGNVLDGGTDSRWSSNFSDDEWVYVDLGADMYISRVGIFWEASFASEYEIQIAPPTVARWRVTRVAMPAWKHG